MKIWNQKLSQIYETRCALTYDQMNITHQVSSKSHNGFPRESDAGQLRVRMINPFCTALQNAILRI